jgi:hypothetical protein
MGALFEWRTAAVHAKGLPLKGTQPLSVDKERDCNNKKSFCVQKLLKKGDGIS